jgi:hypothetical protein
MFRHKIQQFPQIVIALRKIKFCHSFVSLSYSVYK